MNKSPLPRLLLAVLAVIAIWSLVLCWVYLNRAKQVRDTQMMTNLMNSRQQFFVMLVNDCNEYAKHSPAMEQLLRSLSTGPQAAALTAPAAKPPTK
ncbi:MAG TPA: hypothetical protein VJA21_07930 [Verrucomicrobiae bacterium]